MTIDVSTSNLQDTLSSFDAVVLRMKKLVDQWISSLGSGSDSQELSVIRRRLADDRATLLLLRDVSGFAAYYRTQRGKPDTYDVIVQTNSLISLIDSATSFMDIAASGLSNLVTWNSGVLEPRSFTPANVSGLVTRLQAISNFLV